MPGIPVQAIPILHARTTIGRAEKVGQADIFDVFIAQRDRMQQCTYGIGLILEFSAAYGTCRQVM